MDIETKKKLVAAKIISTLVLKADRFFVFVEKKTFGNWNGCNPLFVTPMTHLFQTQKNAFFDSLALFLSRSQLYHPLSLSSSHYALANSITLHLSDTQRSAFVDTHTNTNTRMHASLSLSHTHTHTLK